MGPDAIENRLSSGLYSAPDSRDTGLDAIPGCLCTGFDSIPESSEESSKALPNCLHAGAHLIPDTLKPFRNLPPVFDDLNHGNDCCNNRRNNTNHRQQRNRTEYRKPGRQTADRIHECSDAARNSAEGRDNLSYSDKDRSDRRRNKGSLDDELLHRLRQTIPEIRELLQCRCCLFQHGSQNCSEGIADFSPGHLQLVHRGLELIDRVQRIVEGLLHISLKGAHVRRESGKGELTGLHGIEDRRTGLGAKEIIGCLQLLGIGLVGVHRIGELRQGLIQSLSIIRSILHGLLHTSHRSRYIQTGHLHVAKELSGLCRVKAHGLELCRILRKIRRQGIHGESGCLSDRVQDIQHPASL